jgi:hypothetical protein
MKKLKQFEYNADPFLIQMKSPCQFLVDNRCSIYEERPLLCRIFPFKYFWHENDEMVLVIHPTCHHYKTIMALQKQKGELKLSDILDTLRISNEDIGSVYQLILRNEAIGVLINENLSEKHQLLLMQTILQKEREFQESEQAFLPLVLCVPKTKFIEHLDAVVRNLHAQREFQFEFKRCLEEYVRDFLP